MIAQPSQNAIVAQQDEIATIISRVDALRVQVKNGAIAYSNHVLKLAGQVKIAEEDSKKTHAELADAKVQLELARSKVESIVRAGVEGDISIEHLWRAFCRVASKNVAWAHGNEPDLRASFDQHFDLLAQFQVAVTLLENAGHPVPCAAEIGPAIERTREMRDRIFERWPLTQAEFENVFPLDVDEVVQISPSAFLRSMITVAWSVVRHPFTTAMVDLSTGRCIDPSEIAN